MPPPSERINFDAISEFSSAHCFSSCAAQM
jgi:hypothetical protein